MKGKFAAYLAATVTILLWGMSLIWSDRLLDAEIPVEFFVPVRMAIAAGLLFCLNLATRTAMRIKKGDLLKFMLMALCLPLVYFICETYGLKLTESPTITSLVLATNPIFAMFAGRLLFKEKFGKVNIIGVFITLAGLWIVCYTRTETGPWFFWGILVLLVAVLSEVSQLSFTKHLSDGYAPSVIVMYQFLFGAVVFLPLFLTKGIKSFEPSLYLSWSVIYPTLALAFLCSAVAFTTWAYAIKHLGVAHTSVFLAVVPLVTALAAFLFGEERLSGLQWAGLAVGMIGIYLTQIVLTTKNNNDTERTLRNCPAEGSRAGEAGVDRAGTQA